MTKKIINFILLFLPLIGLAQNEVSGKIVEKNNQEGIPGVVIRWNQNKSYIATNINGEFEINPKTFPDTLTIDHIGYSLTKIVVDKPMAKILVELDNSDTLKAITVMGKNLGKSIDLMSARHTETIGQNELRKAACCNLSEAFETNASIDVSITDAVSGAKKIQMLGLDGIYSQIQWENMPLVRGLSSSYGLSFTPGTWIESIQVTKGTGPVINGYESVSGLINLTLKAPSSEERFYLNTYANIFGRGEVNVHGVQKFGRWKTMNFLHLENSFMDIDKNKDDFRDLPIGFTGSFLNRWETSGENFESKFGIKGVFVDKTGGQIGFDRNNNDNSKYGVGLTTHHLEAFAKNGFFFKNSNTASLGTIVQAKYHYLNNQFGNTVYDGTQRKIYINTIFSDVIGNTNHNYKTGLSFILDDYQQSFNDSAFIKTEVVPGAFFEYTYHYLEKVTVVAGMRGDYHNLFGPLLTPRLHAKWNISPKNVLRISAGRGLRVANPYADYTSLMASSRAWVVVQDLNPEDAINSGITFTQKFLTNDNVSTFTVDYFYTRFLNQVVTDMDISPNEIHIYNAEGTSYSNSFQAELSIKPFKNLELRGAFKYYDVKAEFNGFLQQRAFVPKFRGLGNIGYSTRNKKWEFDLTGNWVGVKRLPHTHQNPIEHQRDHESETYWLVNGQITYKRPKISFYLGGENLLNVIQDNAIIAADDPFGAYFDATQLWAPITGINVYAGLHYTIKYKKK